MRRAGAAVLLGLATTGPAQERADLEVVHRIKQEATRSSQVMDHLFALTDVNGPRLTGSPGFKKAADWAVGRLQGYGIGTARVESWGRFGRGWTLTRYEAHLVEPAYAALPGIPLAWSGGTKGTVTAEVAAAPLWTAEDAEDQYDVAKVEVQVKAYVAAQKGKLQGRIVLLDPAPDLKPPAEAASRRYDEAGLGEESRFPELFAAPPLAWPLKALPADPKKRAELFASLPIEISEDYYRRLERAERPLYDFLLEEGALAVLRTDRRGAGGVAFAEGPRPGRRAPGCLPRWSSWSPRPMAASRAS